MRPSTYREQRQMPYTRVEYIHGVPPLRIAKFVMGTDAPDYDLIARMRAKERVLVRQEALEAARVTAGKALARAVGEKNYCLVIKKFPHHIIREHRFMTGAGADRISEGMRRAYGKPISRAAIVEAGDTIIEVKSYSRYLPQVLSALRTAAKKIPKGARVDYEIISQ